MMSTIATRLMTSEMGAAASIVTPRMGRTKGRMAYCKMQRMPEKTSEKPKARSARSSVLGRVAGAAGVSTKSRRLIKRSSVVFDASMRFLTWDCEVMIAHRENFHYKSVQNCEK